MLNDDKLSTLLKVAIGLLDLTTILLVAGFSIAFLTNSIGSNGIYLDGFAAEALIISIAAYFIIGNDFLGGTLWHQIFRTRQQKSKSSNMR